MTDGPWFEDFTPGRVFRTAGLTLGDGMIQDFAFAWDPQPFHIDREAAARGPFGGLIASGFQTLAATFRLFQQTGALAACSLGGAGLDALRWPAPVRPGDTLTVEVTVVEQRPSRSRPDRGTVRMDYRTVNQRGETVLTCTMIHILARRPAEG